MARKKKIKRIHLDIRDNISPKTAIECVYKIINTKQKNFVTKLKTDDGIICVAKRFYQGSQKLCFRTTKANERRRRMRTIKFRGKCCHSDAWVFGDLEVNRLDKRTLIHTYYDDKRYHCQCDVRADTVGQFTGLYDKNGKEIYEGDILQWGEGDYKIKQVVMFLHGAFGYKCDPYTFIPYVGNTNFDFWAKGTDHRFEIIGNIHDNPELQKGGKEWKT